MSQPEMPRNSRIFLLLAALAVAAGCGQKADKTCPADEQAGCVDSTFGYDAGIADILNGHCKPCHAAGGVEQTILLTDYQHVFGERMSIGGQLVTCTMPPDGSPQLTDTERNQVLDWLSCGAPK